MIRIGIISDTHLSKNTLEFHQNCALAFAGCEAIIHAGDLTDISILAAFSGKDVHAVCGNMCNIATSQLLPQSKTVIFNGFTIGICHGAGPRHNIEERLIEIFPDVDCIVYGHTHLATCHTSGTTLFINPGSFEGTGRYGAAGTYGLLHIEQGNMNATIHQLDNKR